MNKRLISDLSQFGTSLINILNRLVIGTNEIKSYDDAKIYNKDDLILRLNSSTKQYEVLRCMDDGATGNFNPDIWEVYKPLISGIGGAVDVNIDCGTF